MHYSFRWLAMKKLNLLLLCNKPAKYVDANTIIDHIEAFERYSEHTIWTLSMTGDFSKALDLQRFDGIIIHYSLSILGENYLSQRTKQLLRDYTGLKIIFVQDEYRKIDLMISQLHYLGIHILFTCFPEPEIDRIYSPESLPGVAKYNNLTGYIPEWMLQLTHVPRIAQRPLHIGYRGRQLPFWYGELGFEKSNIVDQWQTKVDPKLYNYDVSYRERDRFYGKKWINFLTQCKASLGVESGASVMDFTGALEKEIDLYQLAHPNASFHEVQQRFLLPYEKQYQLNQISPRCFEAIALKTALVLYEGDYSGILSPEQHYIVLKKDFSNIDEVLAKLSDNAYLQALVERAFNDIALNPNYSYQGFIKQVDQRINEQFAVQQRQVIAKAYTLEDFNKVSKMLPLKAKMYNFGLRTYQRLPYRMRLIAKLMLKPYRQRAKK